MAEPRHRESPQPRSPTNKSPALRLATPVSGADTKLTEQPLDEDTSAASPLKSSFSPPNTTSPHSERSEVPLVPGTELDAADDDEFYDPGLGGEDDQNSITASLSSSITKYRFENGRRYHAYQDGAYWGPNDEQAANHLDIANHLFLLTLDGQLHLAPIGDNPQRVLDIGTGTGIWAIDFADQYPSAQVIGTDLSPIQPSWVPPNCKFEIDDAEMEWTYQANSFDFIHVRSLFGCVADWPKFYREVLKCLKPGGYLEHIEMAPGFRSDDGSMAPDTAYYKWHDLGVECGRKMGKTFETIYEMDAFITEAGFDDIHSKTYKWPIGPWMQGKANKEMGMWTRLHIEEGLENWSMAPLTRVLGWTREEVQMNIIHVKRDLKQRSIHGYHEMKLVYARKSSE